ncbi:MAG: sortase [Candidatus Saccharimonadales bacterium]
MADKSRKTVKKKPKKAAPKKDLEGAHVKLKFKNHFLPPLVGLLVAAAVFGLFNSEVIAGRIAYFLSSRHQNTSQIDNTTANQTIDKNAPAVIIINKIKVKAPVIYDQKTVNEANFQLALRDGVVHYPQTAFPGQTGNVVIFGHSSGLWWAPGKYKFVFTLLDKLTVNDKVFIDYKGVRYTYRVTSTKVVQPTDLSVLDQGPVNTLTLITCTPVGTSDKRLIVSAKQLLPVPKSKASASQQSPTTVSPAPLPGNSPSLWQSFKDLF